MSGVVLDHAGHPLNGVVVTLRLGNAAHHTPTNQRGHFAFLGVAEGVGTLTAAAPGFAESEWGQVRPGLPGTPIRLRSGITFGATMTLFKEGVISGHAFGPGGAPAPGTPVYVFRLEPLGDGEDVLAHGGHARADDTGAFRVGGLPPGTFVVLANREAPDSEREPPLHNIAPDRWAIERGGYFPNGTSAALAERIVLAGGQERAGVVVGTRMDPATTVSGVVYGPDGRPSGGVTLLLRFDDQYLPSDKTTSDADGRFVFRRVVAGDATIRAIPSPGRPFVASADIVSDGVTPRSLTLVLRRGATVRGRVSEDVRTHVWIGQASGAFTSDVPGVAAQQAAPEFVFEGLPPGDFRFRAEGLSASGWFATSALVGGIDALDRPFSVVGDEVISDVVITLSNRPASIGGMVTKSGVPSLAHSVLVFPAAERDWRAGSRRIVAVRPDTSGRYLVDRVPPGEYLVAVGPADVYGFPSASLLRSLRPAAQQVSLGEGERRVVNLPVK